MIRDDVVAKLKADEPYLRSRGVTWLVLFGSVVRGEERPDSDVDVLIDVDPNVKFSLLNRAGLMNRLEDMLGRPVGICRREMLKPLHALLRKQWMSSDARPEQGGRNQCH